MARWIAWLSLALGMVSLVSGAVLLFVYHPSNAFETVQKITYLLPFGAFFRELHYFSSELLLLMLLLHIAIELSKKSLYMKTRPWSYGVLGVALVITLLFTGFVLKADQSANAAAQVAFGLIEDTPALSYLGTLFRDTEVFYYRFFIWHILFLPLLFLFTLYKHSKALIPRVEYMAIAAGLSVLLLLVIAMPQDIIPGEQVAHLEGPWFFWGAENLLQMGISSWAVNLFMTLPFILLLSYPLLDTKRTIKASLVLWSTVYIVLSAAWWL